MKKRCLTGLLAGLMLLSVAGCGASSSKSAAQETAASAPRAPMATADEAKMEEAVEMEMAAGATITSENGIEAIQETGRKLIKTVYLDMQTKEFDAVMEGITAKVSELGGYIENSSISGSSASF